MEGGVAEDGKKKNSLWATLNVNFHLWYGAAVWSLSS